MKIVVTGGAGYIGSHTLIDLAEAGFTELVSVDNYVRSTPETFDRLESITGLRITNHVVDLTDRDAVLQCFSELNDIAGIIHFAAFKTVGESVENPLLYYHNNIPSLTNVVEACLENSIHNFIFSSSCSVYGNISTLPVTEQTALYPAESPYGFSKQIGEQLLRDVCGQHPQFRAIALRYFNPVGAHISGKTGELPIGKPNNLVPVITQVAAGILEQVTVFGGDYGTRDGTCVRDYVHVSDIARAHVLALNYLLENKNSANFQVFNLGSGAGVTVLEAIKAFEKVAGLSLNYAIGPRRPGDVEAIYSDCSSAKQLLGWQPKYDIDTMMSTAWKWQENLAELSTKTDG